MLTIPLVGVDNICSWLYTLVMTAEINPPSKKTIGLVLKKLRLKANLTQIQLSSKAFGTLSTQRSISLYEIGRIRPDTQNLAKLAAALNVSVSDIIDTAYSVEAAITPTPTEQPA